MRACEADGGRIDRRAEFRIASGPVPFKQKFTVPRVPPVGTGAIVAVSVTDAPASAGFGDAVSVVVEAGAELIVSVTATEVEVERVSVPLYTAVMLLPPSARLVIAKVATPLAPTFPVPRYVPEPHEETFCAPAPCIGHPALP